MAELIRDLTQGISTAPRLEQLTQPVLDIPAEVESATEIEAVSPSVIPSSDTNPSSDSISAPEHSSLDSTPVDFQPSLPPVNSVFEPVFEVETAFPPEIPSSLPSDLEVTSSAQTSSSQAVELDAAVLEQLDRLLAEPPASTLPLREVRSNVWFLGIDIGTTGISAVLLNQSQCQLYPLYWQPVDAEESFAAQKKFRLPTAVTLPTPEPTSSPLPTIRLEPASPNSSRLGLSDWKPHLKIAVPHHSPQTSGWEPVLQWSDRQTVPLRTIQEVLQQLLATLNPDRASFMPSLTCGALGLETEEFQAVLQNLTGVVVGYPSNWSDTYSFNVREAILQTDLVQEPDQVLFIEEAIATLLSALPAADGRRVTLSHQQGQTGQGQSGHLHNANWQGITLILTAGASLTELVLVNLSTQLQALNHTDFYVRSFPYAGLGIDQDIIIQLLYPGWNKASANSELANHSRLTIDLAIAAIDLDELGLTTLTLPAAAELDFAKRWVLQQYLNRPGTGQQLLTAARAVKIALQHQTQFTLKLGTRYLTIERQELTSQVMLPYVQRLNRELNTLLAQTNTTAAAVNQVICTGGTAALGAIARWLRQKLPNATIIQDTYIRPVSMAENCIPSCSRIAYGLATLPLHPQVFDGSRHQYSDYFLLKTLLHALPQQPIQLETIMQILEQRGIDTQSCRFRILALLEGHLPPGLIPSEPDRVLLTSESAANPDYQAIQLTPLFTKQTDRTYVPNRHTWDYLQHYLNTLLSDTDQTLDQPLTVTLAPLLNPGPQ